MRRRRRRRRVGAGWWQRCGGVKSWLSCRGAGCGGAGVHYLLLRFESFELLAQRVTLVKVRARANLGLGLGLKFMGC